MHAKRFSITHVLRTKTTHRNFSASKLFKRRASPPFDLLMKTKQRCTGKKGRKVLIPSRSNCNKNRRTQTSGSAHKGSAHKGLPLNSFFLLWHRDSSGKPTGPLRTQTSHVSFPTHTFPGTTYPGPCGSLVPPSPTPNNPARIERSCHRNHEFQ